MNTKFVKYNYIIFFIINKYQILTKYYIYYNKLY